MLCVTIGFASCIYGYDLYKCNKKNTNRKNCELFTEDNELTFWLVYIVDSTNIYDVISPEYNIDKNNRSYYSHVICIVIIAYTHCAVSCELVDNYCCMVYLFCQRNTSYTFFFRTKLSIQTFHTVIWFMNSVECNKVTEYFWSRFLHPRLSQYSAFNEIDQLNSSSDC